MAARKPGRWDLTELAGGSSGSDLERRIRRVRQKARAFERVRESLRHGIPAAEFAGILHKLESLAEETSIATGYASLLYAADTQSDQTASLLTRMTSLDADTANRILFFDLWWRAVGEKSAARLMRGTGDLAGYLRHERLISRYTLSEPEERILNVLDVTGAPALIKIYDQITSAFGYRVKVGKRSKKAGREKLAGLARSGDPGIRQAAYEALFSGFSGSRGVLGEIYRNIVLNWRDRGTQIRGYKTPISMRNVANDVNDETVRSLLRSCKKNAPVFQKFFLQKARTLDARKLRRYDLYAPAGAGEGRYSYDKSVRLVMESLDSFSPELSAYARRVFDQNHVDSSLRPGKRDGAFCSTISPGITPFILVNFSGRLGDVFTLAHELGHAVHSQAASGRSILVQSASLPLAETASTFSELLLYDSMEWKMPEGERRAALSGKLDDLYAAVTRQSFFTFFEIDAHGLIPGGATIDDLSSAYMQNLREQFGGSVEVSDDFAAEWACIPHFYHAPFYCYAYSFGNLLALSLFQRYKREGADFVPSYVEILSAGGSRKPEELLAEHGADVSSAKFWQDGFDYISRQVDSLAKMG